MSSSDDIKKATDASIETGETLGAGIDILKTPPLVDDVEIESYNDDVLSGGTMTPQEKMKKLREELRQCEAERKEFLDGWQRLKADFVNYKKREGEEKEAFIKFSREEFITQLLPVLESFHMAFANKEAWEKVDPAWRKGVEYIHTQFTQVLSEHGLVAVTPLGEEFNPKEETSVGTVPTDDPAKEHKIAEVLQPGYRLHGKLIRSPRVKIYGAPGAT